MSEWKEQAYRARVAKAIAEHAIKLTLGEATAVNAVREHLKAKLRGANLTRAMSIFEGGVENANDTVFVERAQPREEWLNMFVGSMMTLLAPRYNPPISPRVVEVFAAIKVAA